MWAINVVFLSALSLSKSSTDNPLVELEVEKVELRVLQDLFFDVSPLSSLFGSLSVLSSSSILSKQLITRCVSFSARGFLIGRAAAPPPHSQALLPSFELTYRLINTMATQKKPLCFKYILIGDTEVGKSALQLSFVEGTYGRTEMTLGVEFSCKNCKIRNKDVRIEIWDTAGQEAYLSVTRTYYRNAHCCVLCFDITRRESFDNVGHWLDEAKRNTGNDDLVVMLVGTKSDLESQRQVSRADAEAYAAAQGLKYEECTAKDGSMVEAVFTRASETVMDVYEASPEKFTGDSQRVKLKPVASTESSADAFDPFAGCCT